MPAAPRLLFVLLSLSLATSFARAADTAPREVRDPHYGEVLFHFYQDNFFTALTHEMAAQHFGQLPRHADEAELLRGGMLLSWGLHLEAGRIFEALIERGAPPPVRNRAWFYLAKIRYQRGYLDEATEAMARIDGTLPGELENERRVLHATLLMRAGQYAQAVAMLKQVPDASAWASYGRFNLGVALVRLEERDKGYALLHELGALPKKGRTEEFASLRDKANVALAYALLQGGQPARAIPYLERSRVNGVMSNKALLGLGWAYAAMDLHQQALTPWVELSERSSTDTAVQESLLATPYAFGKLGAYRQALERYELALGVYTREMERIDAAAVTIRRGALLDGILRDNPGEAGGWAWRVGRLPDTVESRYLSDLVASHDFQEGLKSYRDLLILQRNLTEWLQRIQAYRDMLAARRQVYAERLPRVLAGARALQIDRLRADHERMQSELERVEREGDARALASERERTLHARLARAEALALRLGDTLERDAARDKLRLLRGLLEWDLVSAYPARLWEAKKAARATAAQIGEIDARQDALGRAQREQPLSFDRFEARIDALLPRIQAQITHADSLAVAQQQRLQELAVAELMRRREQLDHYVVQARFAVAQIVDQALRADEAKP